MAKRTRSCDGGRAAAVARAERIGITPRQLAVLKNGRAKAIRFTTLEAICEALDCQPGDLLRWEADGDGQI
ncbi:helix-turn-helix domain-containing protein [Arthrobacter cupressi]